MLVFMSWQVVDKLLEELEVNHACRCFIILRITPGQKWMWLAIFKSQHSFFSRDFASPWVPSKILPHLLYHLPFSQDMDHHQNPGGCLRSTLPVCPAFTPSTSSQIFLALLDGSLPPLPCLGEIYTYLQCAFM